MIPALRLAGFVAIVLASSLGWGDAAAAPAALADVLGALHKRPDPKLTDLGMADLAERLRPQGDAAVRAILAEYRSTTDFGFRHQAIRLLAYLGTPEAQAALLAAALGPMSNQPPSLDSWAASRYVLTITDPAKARPLLASRNPQVLSTALQALVGQELDEGWLRELETVLDQRPQGQFSFLATHLNTVGVLAADKTPALAARKVDLVLKAVAAVPELPEKDKIWWPGSMTHAEGSYHQYINALAEIAGADEPLRKVAPPPGPARRVVAVARARRGDAAVRAEVRQILQDPRAGMFRVFAATALGVIADEQDKALLTELAKSDPDTRDAGGCMAPPGAPNTYYPVRGAALSALKPRAPSADLDALRRPFVRELRLALMADGTRAVASAGQTRELSMSRRRVLAETIEQMLRRASPHRPTASASAGAATTGHPSVAPTATITVLGPKDAVRMQVLLYVDGTSRLGQVAIFSDPPIEPWDLYAEDPAVLQKLVEAMTK